MDLNLPIFDHISNSKSILIAGMGGGFDIFCGLPIYFELKRQGLNVHLANYSFSPFEHLSNGTFLTDSLVGVTADIESGYAQDDTLLEENIERLLQTGIVGINFEDSDKKTQSLLPVETQCRKIRLIRDVSHRSKVPLFINARTDVYTKGKEFITARSRIEETIKRGLAYKDAGADCFFPLAMQDYNEIKKCVGLLQMPINIIIIHGVPGLNVLEEIGIARVSLGPSFLKIAIKAMKSLATKLRDHDGLNEIVENEITSDYLKKLVNKK